MIAKRFGVLSTAALALQEIALAAVLFLLVVAWLHIPDASVFQLLCSAALALLIVAFAGVGEGFIAMRLVNRAAVPRRLLIGCCAMVVATLIWLGVSLWFDHLSMNDGLRAGYVSSRFPSALRNLFSYERLSTWFGWIWSAMRLVAAGFLAAAVFGFLASAEPLRAFVATLRSRRYWFCLLLLVAAGIVSRGLLAWTPGHNLHSQLASLLIRLPVVIVVDAVAVSLLLQAMAIAVGPNQFVGTEAPVSIQPRTLDIP